MAADPLVRPEYGPALPTLLETRLHVPRRLTIGVAIAIVVVAAVIVLLAASSGDTRYFHRQQPAFNLRYAADALKRETPPGWAIVLDQSHGGKFIQSIGVRPATLPPHQGVVSGYLPIYMDHYERQLAKRLDGFVGVDEGKAHINNALGYQITYQAKRGGRTVFGRDVLLVPKDVPGQRQAVVMRLLQTHAAGVHAAESVGSAGAIKKPYRSFRFGLATSG